MGGLRLPRGHRQRASVLLEALLRVHFLPATEFLDRHDPRDLRIPLPPGLRTVSVVVDTGGSEEISFDFLPVSRMLQ